MPYATGLGLPDLDLAGQIRISNGRVDVGAYEWCASAGIPEQARDVAGPRWGISPNPVTQGSAISFELEYSDEVELHIFDLTGRIVRTLALRHRSAGRQHVCWDGHDAQGAPLRAGTYFCRLRGGHVRGPAAKLLMLP